MKICLVCHTEPDMINEAGASYEIERKEQTFEHAVDLLAANPLPTTYSLTVGGRCGEELLSGIVEKIPPNCEMGIHIHYERFQAGRWVPPAGADMSSHEFLEAIEIWEGKLGSLPSSCVFGHWHMNSGYLDLLLQAGIQIDASYTEHKQRGWESEDYVVKAPFRYKGLLEVPAACFRGSALNPFAHDLHKDIVRKLIADHREENILLHLAFHSYDLYRFGGRPERKVGAFAFLNEMAAEGIECVGLSDVPAFADTAGLVSVKSVRISGPKLVKHKLKSGLKRCRLRLF